MCGVNGPRTNLARAQCCFAVDGLARVEPFINLAFNRLDLECCWCLLHACANNCSLVRTGPVRSFPVAPGRVHQSTVCCTQPCCSLHCALSFAQCVRHHTQRTPRGTPKQVIQQPRLAIFIDILI